MATFLAWQRPGAHALTTGGPFQPRRTGEVQLQLTPMTGGAATAVPLPFSLFGAADVSGLRQGAVRRRHPAPGVGDAAPELAAHIEFSAADLPWRYSPDSPAGPPNQRRMRPWLALLAGRDDQFDLLGRARVRIAASVLQNLRLEDSFRWVHVHEDDSGGTLSRILSPCKLPARAACRAVLVPAYQFGAGGALEDAWAPGVNTAIELPLYDTWTFSTTEGDDFPQLASLLIVVDAAALGTEFGATAVGLRGREDHIRTTGALMRPPIPTEPVETPPPQAVSDIIASWPIAEAAGRWVLAPPAYDLPWRKDAVAVTGWPAELLRDPRRRGAAGLGAWCAIDQQDQIADGARRQAGAIDAAAHDFRMLSLGLAAGRSLFEHRLPADPVGRLAVLGPMLRRLPSTEGGTADRALRDRTPKLHPALLSGAVRRTIRPGTALTASAPGVTLVGMLDAANRCPDDERPSRLIETLQSSRGEASPEDAATAVGRWERALGDFARRALDASGEVRTAVERLIDRQRQPQPCRPVDLVRLGGALSHAVDPRRPNAPAIRRVRGRYKGIPDPFPAPVFEPELDLPLAPVLTKLAPHWMLPGRGRLEQHRIVALVANPKFIESTLTGANQRALGELRWRNVRVRSGWSPLRRFWPRPAASDITPLRTWVGDLGDASHRPPNEVATPLVIVVRSPILRRYPGTAVYLLKPSVNVQQLDTTDVPPPIEPRHVPIFKGSLEPDLHYIGFPLTPTDAAGHYLVFEEPMADPRFRMESPVSPMDATWEDARVTSVNGAEYAHRTFHRRTIAIIKLL